MYTVDGDASESLENVYGDVRGAVSTFEDEVNQNPGSSQRASNTQ